MCDDQYWPVYELYDLSIKYSLFIVIIFEICILIVKRCGILYVNFKKCKQN